MFWTLIKPSQKPRCPGSGGLYSVWLVSLIFLFITAACCPVIINCGWPGIFLTQKETTITNAMQYREWGLSSGVMYDPFHNHGWMVNIETLRVKWNDWFWVEMRYLFGSQHPQSLAPSPMSWSNSIFRIYNCVWMFSTHGSAGNVSTQPGHVVTAVPARSHARVRTHYTGLVSRSPAAATREV